MSDYNKLKALYNSQPDLTAPDAQSIAKKGNFHKQKLLISQVIMGLTVLILVYFFFYISAYKTPEVAYALMAMMGALVFRIALEFYSLVWHKRLPIDTNPKSFTSQLLPYERFRRFVHLMATPLAYVSYTIGFITLLPYFKASLSKGFYLYVLWSGVLILTILAVFIGNEARKELKLLKLLRRDT